MKLTNKSFEQMVAKFQEGGEMPAGAPAEQPATTEGAAPAEGGDPMQELLMACQQVLETQDCNLAMQVVQAVMQMLGGGAPAPEQAPAGTEPVYRMGGKLARVIRK
jgi:hypothetical protein